MSVEQENLPLRDADADAVSASAAEPRSAAVREAFARARHVAIVRLGSIGDVVATVPLAWYLRDVLASGTRLSWIVHSASASLLHGLGALDDVIELPKGSVLRSIPRWRRALADRGIDCTLDVHGNLKSGIVSRLTGASRRIGFHRRDCREHWNPLFTTDKLPPLPSPNKTRRANAIAGLLGIAAPSPRFDLHFSAEERERAARIVRELAPNEESIAALQLGRAEDVRSWPIENYAALAERLLASRRRVLVLGGPPEVETGRRVRERLGDRPGLSYEINSLSLREVGAVFETIAERTQDRGAYVGGDSGCLHIAAACGLQTTGLFGPQDPDRTAPIGEHVTSIIHRDAAPCIPCARRECAHSTWRYCMEEISPEEVERAVNGTLRTPKDDGTKTRGARAAARTPSARRTPIVTLSVLAVAIAVAVVRWIVGVFVAGPATSAPSSFPGLLSLVPAEKLPGGIEAFVTAIAAGVALLPAAAIAQRLGTPATGILTAIALGASALVLDPAALGLSSFVLTALVHTTLFLYVASDLKGATSRRTRFASVATALGAFAVGGAPGLLVPALGVIAFRCAEKDVRRLFRPRALAVAAGTIAAAAGITAGLYALARARGMDASWLDALTPITWRRDDVQSPPWQYAVWIARFGLPFVVFAPFALVAHLRNRRYREDLGFADRQWRFPKAVFLAGFVLLSLLPVKSMAIVAALAPSLAILVAAWIEFVWRRRFPNYIPK